MSDALYDEIVTNGLGLSSPSIAVADNSISDLNSVNSALDALPIATPPAPGFTQEWVDSAKAPVNSSVVELSSAQTTMQTNCDNVFTSIQMSSSVNRIEGVQGCGDLTNVTGSIMGELDPMFNAISQTAQSQLDLINSFLAGALDINDFMSQFDALGASYQSSLDAIQNQFDKESALLSDMVNKVTSSSLAKSVSLLWNDPCAQAVLDNTLSPDVKDILNQGGL